MAESPIGIAVQRAVLSPSCTLPPELRLYLVALAVLANRKTGRGTSGQERIAACMGVTKRTVQRLGAELATRSDSPVRIERRVRMRRDGRGRNSDEYRLIITDQGDADSALVEADQGDTSDGMVTMNSDTTKATPTDDQGDKPGTTKATPASPNPGSDPRSDPRRSISRDKPARKNAQKSAPSATKRAAPIPAGWQPSEQHRAFARDHGLDLELERVGFVGYFDGQTVKSANGRFTTWLANQAKWKKERGARPFGRAPQQADATEAELDAITARATRRVAP